MMNKEEAIEQVDEKILHYYSGKPIELNTVIEIINQIGEPHIDGYTVKKPLGVLLVDMPEESLEKYYYLYKSTDDKLAVGSINSDDLLIKIGLTVTEAEAKEKYPNFKWVSLEELENE